jgi:hypothetical protein
MTTITCDLCKSKINGQPIKVIMRDGEHPHNGSTMYTTVDCCDFCIRKLPLECNAEVDDYKQ